MKSSIIFLAFILNIAIGFSQNLQAGIGCDKDSSGIDPYIVRCVMKFVDESTGAPVSWFWDFGDGRYSTDQNPWHAYDFYFFSYQLTLVVQDISGNSDTAFYTFFNDTSCSCNKLTGINPIPGNRLSSYFSPNPIHNTSELIIQSGFITQNTELRVYNSLGMMVRNQRFDSSMKIRLDRNNLCDGLYYYELSTADFQILAKGNVLIN